MYLVVTVTAAVNLIPTQLMNIQTFNDFLPHDILDQFDQEIVKRGWHYGWRSRATRKADIPFSHWNIDFTNAGGENGLDVVDKLTDPILSAWNYIKENHFAGARLVRCYINGHTYGVEGYPHKDSIRNGDKTLLVYLNQEWKRDWGGETVFYDKDQVLYAELPKRNKAILFDGNVYHVAKGVTRACASLRVTLMFKITTAESIDPVRDQIQEFLSLVNADNTAHSANSLTGHLLRTYDHLKYAGQSQDICNAGAVHSLFGTNIFQWNNRLTVEDKPRIAAVAGEKATQLSELFSQLPRPGILESYIGEFDGKLITLDGSQIEVSAEDFNALCVIEAANLFDQSGLDPYPKLSKLWDQLNTQ